MSFVLSLSIVLSLCAASMPSIAASHIHSPSFGAFVKTGPGITLDASVSSTNTPGSCDFSPSAHPYLKRPEATAFYALFDNYYAHQVSTREWDVYRTCSPFASHRPVNNHTFLTVTTNALFNYSALMTCADNLVNKTYGDGYYIPFYRKDQWTTSSAFDNLFGSWDTSDFQPTITLDNWRILAVISDLDNDDVFHYRISRWTHPYWNYPLLRDLFGEIHFNEYDTGGSTIPDLIYAFDNDPSLYDEPMGYTFKDLADLTWPDNDIYQITNRSRSISWKPLCAISQTLALMDSTIAVGDYDANIWTRIRHSEGVTHSYSRRASAPNCGAASFTINSDGTLETDSTPRPSPSGVEIAPLDSSTYYPEESGIFYALRVGSVGHYANVSCKTNITSSLYEELDVADILFYCGFTNRDAWCQLDLKSSPTVYWPQYAASIEANVNEGPWHDVGYIYGDISDIAGSYAVTIVGGVRAGYDYSEDNPYAITFQWNKYQDQKANVETVREYAILSYAVTKYAHGTDFSWFAPIDFGYYPPSAKPSPVDDTMKYGYMRCSFETNAVSYDAVKYAYDLDLLNTAKNKIHQEVMAITGGEFGDPEVYLGLDESAVRDLLGEYEFQYAEMEYLENRSAFNVYVSPSGATTPEKIRCHANASVTLYYAREGGSSKTIHRAAGGDAKLRAAQKYKMAYPSLRTY